MYFYKFQLCSSSGTYSKLAAGLQSALDQWKDQLSEWYRVPSKYIIFDKIKRLPHTSSSIITYRIRIKKQHRPHKTSDFPNNKKFEVTLPAFNFPKYIWRSSEYKNAPFDRDALKLISSSGHEAWYWRNAGCWSTTAHASGGRLLVEHPLDKNHIYVYEECTEQQWWDDNYPYTTHDYDPGSCIKHF